MAISGLDNQIELVSLYLHNNAISKIENLDHLVNLHTINLSHNFIKVIENLGEHIHTWAFVLKKIIHF